MLYYTILYYTVLTYSVEARRARHGYSAEGGEDLNRGLEPGGCRDEGRDAMIDVGEGEGIRTRTFTCLPDELTAYT